jgi:hypothetical protein
MYRVEIIENILRDDIVRYSIYCIKNKKKYYRKYQRNKKIERIITPTMIALLREIQVHLPLRGENLQ